MTTEELREELEALRSKALAAGMPFPECMSCFVMVLAMECLRREDSVEAAAELGRILTNAVRLGAALDTGTVN